MHIFHKWEVKRSSISNNSAWEILTEKCTECDSTRNRAGKVILMRHIPIPEHKHVDATWEGTDYPPPAITAFCENCNKVARLREFKTDSALMCPSCETGNWLFFYYSPCCYDALKSKHFDHRVWTKRVLRGE